MAYDITAVLASVAILVAVLWDGRISKWESYLLLVCCAIVGATSFVVGLLDSILFNRGANAYVIAAILLFIVIAFKKFTEKIRGYIIGACALVLGSSQAITSWLPPLVNGWFDVLAAFFGGR
jgi:hypothetical protein